MLDPDIPSENSQTPFGFFIGVAGIWSDTPEIEEKAGEVDQVATAGALGHHQSRWKRKYPRDTGKDARIPDTRLEATGYSRFNREAMT